MPTPLIVLVGPAGSGKNTVGEFLEREFNAVQIAQADPLKRFCKKVFGFSDLQLWGPSEARNAVDPRYTDGTNVAAAESLVTQYGPDFIHETMPPEVDPRLAYARLEEVWFRECVEAMFAGGLSPRIALQLLGTEWGRALYDQVWVDYAGKVALKMLGGNYTYTPTEGLVKNSGQPGAHYAVITDGRFQNEVVGALARGGVAWRLSGRAGDLGSNGKHLSETELNGIPRHFFSAEVRNTGTIQDLQRATRRALIESGFRDGRADEDSAPMAQMTPQTLIQRSGN